MNAAVHTDGSYHTFVDYPQHLQNIIPGIIVPQHVFNSPTHFSPREPMRFVCNGKLGIRLTDAVNGRNTGLQNATHPVRLVHDGATTFTFAIHWPGYQVWQQTGGSPLVVQNIPLAQLAMTAAKLTITFLRKTAESGAKSSDPKADWEITNVALDSLFLLELRHLGGGAWQPVLCRDMT